MKKLLLFVVSLGVTFSLFLSNVSAIEKPEVTDHEKVKINLFHSSSCSHCKDFLKYFGENWVDYEDYFEVVTYEVSSSPENGKVLDAVKKALNNDDDGVPFISIGGTYFKVGFGKSTGKEIIEEALKEYQNKNYIDLVGTTIKENKLDSKKETLKEACASGEIKFVEKDKKNKISDNVVIIIIFVVVIGGFSALMFTSRNKD